MGIRVDSSELLPSLGLQLSGFVVTMNGRFTLTKLSAREYQCITHLNYYATEDAYNSATDTKQPIIREQQLVLVLGPQDLSRNIFVLIYNRVKEQFATCVDV